VELGEGSATVDGAEHRVEASGMSVQAAAPRKAPTRKKAAAAGANSVQAMMPGAILKVLVAEGDEVAEGEVVVVLEAMKMENEIHAHRSGVVKMVHVAPGESVENNQALIEIE
jgi:biotin carboxyl carrier protein